MLRYDGGGVGPHLGYVGKAVTFDTGGISIKPAAKMQEMKFDMSGGAAVIEAMGAIAALDIPVRITAVVPSTENMPSGHSMKPGDIVTAMNGKTIEINNTDAEGRLILADALAYAVAEGAERIVDLATLTGAIVVALGSTYAGLFSNDDDWYGEVEAASSATGELGWRMPLHPEFFELTKGVYADLTNASDQRKASSSLRRRVPAPVRGRPAVGARGHRGHGVGPGPRLQRERRVGLRRADAGGAGAARGGGRLIVMAGALEGKVAAITGASSGIGEATALALAGAGAAVALGRAAEDRLQALAKRIEGDGGRALALAADVSDEDSARAFVSEAHSQLGGLDILVNNAGVMLLGPVEGADTAQWRTMVDVNLLGLLYCTHAALPLMRSAGSGHIVNISSVAGARPTPAAPSTT